MIIDASKVFDAKRTYDKAIRQFGSPRLPFTYESAVEIQRDKKLIQVAIEECRSA